MVGHLSRGVPVGKWVSRLSIGLLVAVATTACPPPPPPPVPEPSSTAWIDNLLNSATTTNTSQPTQQLAADDFQDLLDSIRSWATPTESIASQLDSIGGWSVVGQDLETFAQQVCFVGPDTAAANLLEKIPDADLSALPALQQAIGVVYQTCQVRNQAAIDIVSNQISRVLLANQQQVGLPTPPPQIEADQPAPAINAYKVVCAGAGSAAALWAKGRISAGGGGGFALSFILAAATAACPDLLSTIFG
jgi:hypothetical protein